MRYDEEYLPEPKLRKPTSVRLLRGKADGARCAECPFALNGQPSKPVMGEGPANPRWMIIGEGPGQVEITLNRPFVGPSGHLVELALDTIKVDRAELWIGNATLCLPMPGADEALKTIARKCCMPRFLAEIARHPGKPILALGAVAAQALINPTLRINDVAGSYNAVNPDGTGIRAVIPSVHPAAILRGGAGVAGAHAPDLAFWNLVYDAAKVESIANGKDIRFREEDIYTECYDAQRAEQLVRMMLQEARHCRMVAVDTETYVDDENRHSALQPINAKMKAIGVATPNWGLSVAWNIITPAAHRLLGAMFADLNIRKIMHNRIYDCPVLRRHGLPVCGVCDDCYLDAETEFLTRSGWKRYDDVREGEEVGTIDRNGALEWQQPFERVSKAYVGPVLVFETKHTRAVVTPNHRMWCQPVKRSAQVWNGRPYGPWQFIHAENMLADGESFFVQQTCRLTNTPKIGSDELPADVLDHLHLLGLWISDGSTQHRGDILEGIVISQEQGGRAEALLYELQRRFPLRTSTSVHREEWRTHSCVEVSWRLNDTAIAEGFVNECGRYSAERRLPSWVWDAAPTVKRALFEGLFAGDGTIEGGPHDRVIYRTCSNQLADDVQALALSIGWTASSRPSTRNDGMRYVYILRQVATEVQIRARLEGRNTHVKSVSVEGRIVCFSVPNETLVTRSQGKPAFYGNTMLKHHNAFPGLSHNLQRVATQYFAISPWKSEFRHGKDSIENLTVYNGKDVLVTARLDAPLNVAIERTSSRRTYDVDLVCAEVAEWMHDVGVPVSREVNQELYVNFERSMAESRAVIEEAANKPEVREELWMRLAAEQARRIRRGSGTRPDPLNFEDRKYQRLEEIHEAVQKGTWSWDIKTKTHVAGLLALCGVPLEHTKSGQASVTSALLGKYSFESPIVKALHDFKNDPSDWIAKDEIERYVANPDIQEKLWDAIATEQAHRPRQAAGKAGDPENYDERVQIRLAELREAYEKGEWTWNIGSTDHVAAYLKARGVHLFYKTDKGQTSTKKEILEQYVHVPEVRGLLDYRESQKLFSTFVASMFDRCDADGNIVSYGYADQDDRVHPRWSVHKITGRWGAEDPMCQNWSKGDTKRGVPNLRTQVVAPARRQFVGFDFSQLESRIIALMSGDPWLCAVFAAGKDIHSEFSRIVFPNFDELPVAERKKVRDAVKRTEFGSFYGGQIDTLWKNLAKDYPEVSQQDVARMVKVMTANMPGVTSWHQKLLRDVAKPPYEIRSAIYGRRRCFPLGNADVNDVYNYPVQSTAADILDTGLMRILPRLRHDYHDAWPILQIHDAMVFECNEDDAERLRDEVKECFTQEHTVNSVTVHFPIDVKIGKNWADV